MAKKSMTVLVVDDDRHTRDTLEEIVQSEGHRAWAAENGTKAFEIFGEQAIDIVITDLRLPDTDGMEILERISRNAPGVPVVLITAHGSEDVAVSAIKRGACDYLPKPLDLHRFRAVLETATRTRGLYVENEGLHRELDSRRTIAQFVGESAPIKAIKETIAQVAPTNASVLIQGANGTGKELVANAIQAASERSKESYVKVAVAALPRELLESELFGHEKGAFTGAHKMRKGRFEMANRGTLFLDEIGTMPTETQVKLLRVLQERAFERVGGSDTISSDIRLISATNEDLELAMKEGRFRQDLYYRINVIHITLPELTSRLDDIPLLVDHFLAEFPSRDGMIKRVSPELLDELRGYDWPGNVRELRNLVERICITSPTEVIEPGSLPAHIRNAEASNILENADGRVNPEELLAHRPLDDIEMMAITATLKGVGGNKTKAARELGIGLKTLYRKLEKYGIAKE